MAWVATDRNGKEWVYVDVPVRGDTTWYLEEGDYIELPKGSIKKLIGRDLTWDDEPIELKEN